MGKHVAIIGGGPAGVEAALAAAPYADQVTIISDRPVGSWHKLMPSRVWLTAIERISALARPPLASSQAPPRVDLFDLAAVTACVRQIAQEWNIQQQERLRALGVRAILGRATFRAATRLAIETAQGSTELHADAVIVAAGSAPVFPASLAPDRRRVFSPDTIDDLPFLPRSVLVIGDGPPGFEFVHIFSRLQAAVTWLVLAGGPRSGVAPEADTYLVGMLERRGVRVAAGAPVVALERQDDRVAAVRADGTRYEAELAFVNLGQRASLGALDLTAAGLAPDAQGQVVVDDYGGTLVPGLYLVGDARQPRAASVAMAQARVAALHAVGQPVTPFEWASAVLTFNADPQVARVGRLAGEDAALQSVTIPFAEALAAHVAGRTEGFLTLTWDAGGRVAGGLAVGHLAAEALAPLALAIKLRTTVAELAALYGPHPAIGELAFIAARAAGRCV
jgi:pyruvate/2-oxoglutarate dehydrogenase complex dihydrolipoamide dehydrogenase (E3) component